MWLGACPRSSESRGWAWLPSGCHRLELHGGGRLPHVEVVRGRAPGIVGTGAPGPGKRNGRLGGQCAGVASLGGRGGRLGQRFSTLFN